jgi:hypothetical protein
MSAATAVQIEANRANAQLSTGPRTEEGKQRSSQNSLKHGVTAKSDVLPAEDPDPYKRFARSLIAGLKPQGELETQIARNIASIQWRLRRLRILTDEILVADLELTKQVDALNKLSLYEQRLTRTFDAAMKQLRDLQQRRTNTVSTNEIQPAKPVNGFVFSSPVAAAPEQPLFAQNLNCGGEKPAGLQHSGAA